MLEPDAMRSEVTQARSAPSRGMGRGLAAILSVSDPATGGDELRDLPVDVIDPNANQPRKAFDEAALQALADSIGERGLLQPVHTSVETSRAGRPQESDCTTQHA